MPDCMYVTCFYVVQSPYTITTAQRAFFEYPGQSCNARKAAMGKNPDAYQTVYNFAPFPVSNMPTVPAKTQTKVKVDHGSGKAGA